MVLMLINFSLTGNNILTFLGGAGAGKSFLICTIATWAERTLRQPGDNPNLPKILLLGPTGMSASLIGKDI